jgi:hypothetical protein
MKHPDVVMLIDGHSPHLPIDPSIRQNRDHSGSGSKNRHPSRLGRRILRWPNQRQRHDSHGSEFRE